MQRICWLVGIGAVLGCSAKVDLGEVSPGPVTQTAGSKLKSFAATPFGMCGVFENHQTYCWGREGSVRAERVANLDGVALDALTTNDLICVARPNGTVACGASETKPLQSQLGVTRAVDVSVGYGQGCALRNDGTVQHWFLSPECPFKQDPSPIRLPSRAVQVECEDNGGCAVTEDGRLFCFEVERLPDTCTAEFEEVRGVGDATAVSLTMDDLCVLHRDGTVSCAKTNWTLGNDAAIDALKPVPNLGGVVQMHSSRIATCGLVQSGELRCWGLSECGSLGISEDCGFTMVSSPITVQSAIDTRLFGMSDSLTCSLDASDEVWCWGLSGWDGEAKGSPLPRRIVF